MTALGLHCFTALSLTVVGECSSPVVVNALLTVVASRVAELRLSSDALQQLQHVGSVAVPCGLGCSVACGIVLDQRSNKHMSPELAGGFFTTEPPGEPQFYS